MNDELTELLAKIYVRYPFMKEGECEWYTFVYVVSIRGESKLQMVYVCLYLVSIRGRREVRMVYMCDIHVKVCVAHSLK